MQNPAHWNSNFFSSFAVIQGREVKSWPSSALFHEPVIYLWKFNNFHPHRTARPRPVALIALIVWNRLLLCIHVSKPAETYGLLRFFAWAHTKCTFSTHICYVQHPMAKIINSFSPHFNIGSVHGLLIPVGPSFHQHPRVITSQERLKAPIYRREQQREIWNECKKRTMVHRKIRAKNMKLLQPSLTTSNKEQKENGRQRATARNKQCASIVPNPLTAVAATTEHGYGSMYRWNEPPK